MGVGAQLTEHGSEREVPISCVEMLPDREWSKVNITVIPGQLSKEGHGEKYSIFTLLSLLCGCPSQTCANSGRGSLWVQLSGA